MRMDIKMQYKLTETLFQLMLLRPTDGLQGIPGVHRIVEEAPALTTTNQFLKSMKIAI